MKPDWKYAPHWADYLAKDSDGEWYWHESIPEAVDGLSAANGRWELAHVPDWDETLEERP